MNLIQEAWIPVHTASGQLKIIRPDEIACLDDPPISVAWGRPVPDLYLATLEFLIGLIFLVHPPRNTGDWRNKRPSAEQLREDLQRLIPAFHIDGDGYRFMQPPYSLTAQGETTSLCSLFFDGERANERKLNAISQNYLRETYSCLSPGAAAISLFQLQIWAGAGGRGYQSGLRGGGPWVTLAIPLTDQREPTLWEIVWANIPEGRALQDLDALPWMQDDPFNVRDVSMPESERYVAETFFSMPRAVRLLFDVQNAVCPLTQIPIRYGAFQYERISDCGRRYRNWRHPLSPWQRKTDGEGDTSFYTSCSNDRLTYKDWTGIVLSDTSSDSHKRYASDSIRRYINDEGECRVMIGGWYMKQDKAIAFAWKQDAVAVQKAHESEAWLFIQAGNKTWSRLISALTGARAELKVRSAKARRLAIETDFFECTEPVLRNLLQSIGDTLLADLKEEWIKCLQKVSLDAFQREVLDIPLSRGDMIREPATVQKKRIGLLAFFTGQKNSDIRTLLELPAIRKE